MTIVFTSYKEPVFVIDSEGYIEYADAIIDGSFFRLRGPENLSQALTLRTPGYPLLLAASKVISTENECALYAYRVISYAVVLAVFYIVGPFVLAPVIGISLISALSSGIVFYPMIMTEWFALNMLILFFALLFSFYKNSSIHTLFFVGLTISLVCLIRPALIFAGVIPFILVLSMYKKKAFSCLLYSERD